MSGNAPNCLWIGSHVWLTRKPPPKVRIELHDLYVSRAASPSTVPRTSNAASATAARKSGSPCIAPRRGARPRREDSREPAGLAIGAAPQRETNAVIRSVPASHLPLLCGAAPDRAPARLAAAAHTAATRRLA